MTSSLGTHAVPGQAAGYSYQFDLALRQLADGSTGGRVGIETLDDVAKEDGDGNLTLIQGKNSVDDESRPFSDGSFGLWNALHTWSDAIHTSEVDPRVTHFDLVSNTIIPDCLARELAKAGTDGTIPAVIAKLRATPKAPSQKASPHVVAVRAMPDAVLTSLISRIRCFDKSGGMGLTEIHRDIVARLKLPSGVNPEAIIEELLGWIKVQVQQKWNAKLPGWILQEHFNNRLHSAIEKNRRRRVRELPARNIVCSTEDVERHKTSCFVRQLELIDSQGEEIEESIIDFLRHNRERLRLTGEGDISDEDWSSFDDRLIEHWKPLFRKHAAFSKAKQRKAGRALYGEIQNHRELLAGQATVEFYLTRGGFHRLADAVTLGWHPEFQALCKSFKGGK